MAGEIEARIEALGLTLPEPPAPAAAYVPYVRTGDLLHVSGQIPVTSEGIPRGKLGEGVNAAEGQAVAQICALNLIAQVRAACDGDLDRVRRVVKLVGFVNSAPDFTDQPTVVNGASEVILAVFGDKGRHARSAVGVAALPLGVPVEVEGVFEID
jgi:enamine deaminase RidA (YjgF/YER057c/UK114 family)